MSRILLAEDDLGVLKMTRLRLEHEGFEVVVATDGQEALERVARAGVDLILLDVRMPKLDGFEVCQRLKQEPATAGIPVIIFTASTARWGKMADRCIELGVVDWLKKPFQSRELLEKVRRALRTGGGRRG